MKDHYWSAGSSGHKAVVSQDIFSKKAVLNYYIKKVVKETITRVSSSCSHISATMPKSLRKYVSFHLNQKSILTLIPFTCRLSTIFFL